MNVFQSSSRRALRPLRRYSRRAVAATAQWLSPRDNPFLMRAHRTEERAHKPFSTILGAFVCIALALWGVSWLWTQFIETPSSYSRTLTAPDDLPRGLGRHPLGLFASVTLLVSVLCALHSTRSRAASLLKSEHLGNTLDHLQMMPVAEERWLWWMSAQPWLLSLLLGLIGLPIYVAAVLSGVWSALDLVGVALLFALIGLITPAWQPQSWQQQAAKKAGRKVGALLAPPKKSEAAAPPKSEMTPAEIEASDDAKIEQMKSEVGKTGVAKNSGCGTWVWVWLGFQGFGGGLRWLISGGNGIGLFWNNFLDSLPPSVTELVGSGPITFFYVALNWPLIIARVLLASLPFFAHSLMPVVLITPFLLALRHQQVVALGGRVTGAETFWSARRMRRKREIGALLWCLFALLFFGYGWQTLVRDSVLHVALRGAPFGLTPAIAWSLAALWTLCIVAGTVIAGTSLEAPLKAAALREKAAATMLIGALGAQKSAQELDPYRQNGELTPMWRAMAWSAARAVLLAVAAYFVLCWLGGQSGVHAIWRSRLPITLAMSAAFLLAYWGAATLQSAVAPDLRPTIRTIHGVWFIGLALLVPLMMAFNFYYWGRAFSFDQMPIVLLSPFVSLFSLLRYDIQFPFNPWWPPLVQATLGLLCFGIAHTIEERRRGVQPAAIIDEEQSEPRSLATRILDILLWPFSILSRGLRAVFTFLGRVYTWMEATLKNWNARIVAPFARWNNPVLSEELRRRLNAEWWIVQWLGVALGALTLFALTADPLRYLATGAGLSGSLIAYLAVSCALISTLNGLILGRSLDRERANGTLVFLFLTPLTEREILIGKLLPSLLHGAIWLVLALPWIALGALIDGANNDWNTLTVAARLWAMAVVHWIFIAALGLLCAVKARRPAEGVGYAFGAVAILEAIVWVGLARLFTGSFDFSYLDRLALDFTTFAFIAALILLVIAFASWKLALISLRKLRYNDQTQRGKGAS